MCILYGAKKTLDINEHRYELLSVKASQSDQLPSTKNPLRKHIERANYQSAVWLQAEKEIPDPSSHWWQVVDGALTVQWMAQKPAPDELLLVSCGCQTGCISARCSCVRGGLRFIDACSCSNCGNTISTQFRVAWQMIVSGVMREMNAKVVHTCVVGLT